MSSFFEELVKKTSELEREFVIDLIRDPSDDATRNAYIDYLKDEDREKAVNFVENKGDFNKSHFTFYFNSGRIAVEHLGDSKVYGRVNETYIAYNLQQIESILGPLNSGYIYPIINSSGIIDLTCTLSGYPWDGTNFVPRWRTGSGSIGLPKEVDGVVNDFSSYFEKVK